MPPRSAPVNAPSGGPESEVTCPLIKDDGKPCRKRCTGEKRFRSMQEHIRRAHPDRWIPKLPATHASFMMMTTGPPAGSPRDMHKTDASAETAVSDASSRIDAVVSETNEAGASFESSMLGPFIDDLASDSANPHGNLLLSDDMLHDHVTDPSAGPTDDLPTMRSLDSHAGHALTSDLHPVSSDPVPEFAAMSANPGETFVDQSGLAVESMQPLQDGTGALWGHDTSPYEPAFVMAAPFNQLFDASEAAGYPFIDSDFSVFPAAGHVQDFAMQQTAYPAEESVWDSNQSASQAIAPTNYATSMVSDVDVVPQLSTLGGDGSGQAGLEQVAGTHLAKSASVSEPQAPTHDLAAQQIKPEPGPTAQGSVKPFTTLPESANATLAADAVTGAGNQNQPKTTKAKAESKGVKRKRASMSLGSLDQPAPGLDKEPSTPRKPSQLPASKRARAASSAVPMETDQSIVSMSEPQDALGVQMLTHAKPEALPPRRLSEGKENGFRDASAKDIEKESTTTAPKTIKVPLKVDPFLGQNSQLSPRQIGLAKIHVELFSKEHPGVKGVSEVQLARPEDEQDPDERPSKKARRDSIVSDSKASSLRFACPYQVMDSSQGCLKEGSRHLGGCGGIVDLKQHLARRHSPSYRCQRCWRAFSAISKVAEHHQQQPECETKELPQHERLMSGDDEKNMKRISADSPEEAWWKYFQLLIPGMRDQDLNKLKMQYWPYYSKADSSFMIPAVKFSHSCEPGTTPSQAQRSAGYASNPSPAKGSKGSSASSLDLSHADPSLMVHVPARSISVMKSQTLSVPLFEVSKELTQETVVQQLFTPPQTSMTDGSLGFQSPTGENPLTPVSSEPTPTDCLPHAGPDSPHHRQKINKETRGDLDRVGHILGDVLSSGCIPKDVYHKISEVSVILAAVRERVAA